MLRPCVRSVEGEASGKGLSKDLKHRVHSSWPMNQKELIQNTSCTHSHEGMQIKQSQIPHLELISWLCLSPQHLACLPHFTCRETYGRSCLLMWMSPYLTSNNLVLIPNCTETVSSSCIYSFNKYHVPDSAKCQHTVVRKTDNLHTHGAYGLISHSSVLALNIEDLQRAIL